jgi:hypothetical protein
MDESGFISDKNDWVEQYALRELVSRFISPSL